MRTKIELSDDRWDSYYHVWIEVTHKHIQIAESQLDELSHYLEENFDGWYGAKLEALRCPDSWSDDDTGLSTIGDTFAYPKHRGHNKAEFMAEFRRLVKEFKVILKRRG